MSSHNQCPPVCLVSISIPFASSSSFAYSDLTEGSCDDREGEEDLARGPKMRVEPPRYSLAVVISFSAQKVSTSQNHTTVGL